MDSIAHSPSIGSRYNKDAPSSIAAQRVCFAEWNPKKLNKICIINMCVYIIYKHTTLNAGSKCHVDKTTGQKKNTIGQDKN